MAADTADVAADVAVDVTKLKRQDLLQAILLRVYFDGRHDQHKKTALGLGRVVELRGLEEMPDEVAIERLLFAPDDAEMDDMRHRAKILAGNVLAFIDNSRGAP